MALMAVCPACGVENSPMNTSCDMCKAPLGAGLREGRGAAEPKPLTWLLISAAITVGFTLVPWLFELHPITVAVAMFYGPLLAAYLAKDNIVGHAAIGGLLGLVILVGVSMVLTWDESRVLLTTMMGGRPRVTDYLGVTTGTSLPIALSFGILVLLVSILPVCLVGASVGEHLSLGRRRRRGQPVGAVAPAAMSDVELSRVEL